MNIVKKNIKAVTRTIKKLKNNSFFRAKFIYTRYYEKLQIDSNSILVQSYSGTSISGNPFYILQELCTNEKFKHFNKYVAVTNDAFNDVSDFLENQNFNNVTIVILHTKEYCKVLASAKFLINNVTFPFYFIKKEGQVYLNTWHGTPLKALGKSMQEDMHTIGNVQRNFLMSDYLLEPNEFTMDIIRNDYMLNQFYTGKYLINGYPRNHIFYNKKYQHQLREELELNGKKIVTYMPTWRGTHALRNDTEQYIYIMHLLIELEKNIDDNTIVFVKEHNMSSLQIDFTQFEKIKPFPNIYETYQFLSITDCLITDYSSVMFDYANTGRKIILYAYDEEEYFKDRGMYIDFKTLPFVKCRTTVEVINELSQIDKYVSYEEEINKYISYDKTNTITDLLNLMIENKLSEKLNVIDGTKYRNNKENVLVFTGALLKNGITTALSGILNNVDAEEKNYILTFTAKSVAPNKKTISKLGDFDYFSIQGQVNLLIHEAIISFLYYRLNLHNKYIDNVMKNRYEREIKRIYPYVHFDYVIHYTGYERKFMNLFRFIDAKKMIYVHNNLIKESKTRNNIHLPSLKTAYKEYDKIVIIRESMKEELIFDSNLDIKEKVMLAHNLNNYDLIIENSKQELLFDEDTVCNKELEEVKSILNDKKGNIFIDVARFSVEKGLDNLVSAFEEHYSSCPDDYLIIIGGHGNTYEDLMIQVENSQAKDHIIIIKSLSNPFPVLGKSDAFVLSSHYEGLPMVIMEALILNKPVISTDITGPREFLSQGYGYLVPDSIEGLVKGMKMYTDTKLVDLKPFDYVDFNKKAINEFYSLFD